MMTINIGTAVPAQLRTLSPSAATSPFATGPFAGTVDVVVPAWRERRGVYGTGVVPTTGVALGTGMRTAATTTVDHNSIAVEAVVTATAAANAKQGAPPRGEPR